MTRADVVAFTVGALIAEFGLWLNRSINSTVDHYAGRRTDMHDVFPAHLPRRHADDD